MTTFDISEKITRYKITYRRHINHNLSRSMIRPSFIKIMCLLCNLVKSSGKNIESFIGTPDVCFVSAIVEYLQTVFYLCGFSNFARGTLSLYLIDDGFMVFASDIFNLLIYPVLKTPRFVYPMLIGRME